MVVSTGREELEKMGQELGRESEKVSLKVNMNKIKYMTNIKSNEPRNTKIYEELIERVSEFKFLGQIVALEDC